MKMHWAHCLPLTKKIQAVLFFQLSILLRECSCWSDQSIACLHGRQVCLAPVVEWSSGDLECCQTVSSGPCNPRTHRLAYFAFHRHLWWIHWSSLSGASWVKREKKKKEKKRIDGWPSCHNSPIHLGLPRGIGWNHAKQRRKIFQSLYRRVQV